MSFDRLGKVWRKIQRVSKILYCHDQSSLILNLLTNDKEDKITAQNTHTRNCGILFTGAVAYCILLKSPLAINPMIVRGEEDNKEINDKLNNLRNSYSLLPRYSNTHTSQSIVGVCSVKESIISVRLRNKAFLNPFPFQHLHMRT